VSSDTYLRIYAMVDSIPRGKVATYGQIAREAGLPRRARLVGTALRNLPKGSKLPWHRVVQATGKTAVPAQRRLLRAEGVRFDRTGAIDLARHGWTPDWT
jgi:methylated-DNA-protein-cysteine methyltransferase-like protein